MSNIKFSPYLSLIIILLCGCANMAQGPTGGKMDQTPPKYISSTPNRNGKNVKDKHIEILFDEYLQISNPSQNMVVSPPQKSTPPAKVIGKKVVVDLKDSLIDNTTYTIDFGDCIGDYTENNRVKNYCLTFSTGDEIDSMSLSGRVLDAETLIPEEGTIVGIYSSDADSLFKTKAFERIARTNASGEFIIKGAKKKQYYIYALSDINGNYFYDQVSEAFAFQESMLPIPSVKEVVRFDTTYKDSAVIDTIIRRVSLRNIPDSIILRLSSKETKLQEFNKIDRTDRKFFQLFLTKKNLHPTDEHATDMPIITPVNFTADNWFMAESSRMADTIKYWITDTTVLKTDSLQLSVTYLKTDSAEKLVSQTDTLYIALSKNYLKQEEKQQKTLEARRARAEKTGKVLKRENILHLSEEPSSLDFGEKPSMAWTYPTISFHEEMCHLYMIKDTDTTAINASFIMHDDKRKIDIEASISPKHQYVLMIDSAAAFDYYGNHNNKIEISISKKEESEYGTVSLHIKNAPENAVVQLINNNDKMLREAKLAGENLKFTLLDKGVYYVRLFSDTNNNGRWDPGCYEEKRQPERMFYLPKQLKVRQNWEFEEDWDVTATPLHQQRLSEIKSDKKGKK